MHVRLYSHSPKLSISHFLCCSCGLGGWFSFLLSFGGLLFCSFSGLLVRQRHPDYFSSAINSRRGWTGILKIYTDNWYFLKRRCTFKRRWAVHALSDRRNASKCFRVQDSLKFWKFSAFCSLDIFQLFLILRVFRVQIPFWSQHINNNRKSSKHVNRTAIVVSMLMISSARAKE